MLEALHSFMSHYVALMAKRGFIVNYVRETVVILVIVARHGSISVCFSTIQFPISRFLANSTRRASRAAGNSNLENAQ